jgi:hypothetical protein
VAARRRRLLAWLFDWVVGPALAIGALTVLFVVLAVLRMRLVGPVSNEAALMFGGTPAGGAGSAAAGQANRPSAVWVRRRTPRTSSS